MPNQGQVAQADKQKQRKIQPPLVENKGNAVDTLPGLAPEVYGEGLESNALALKRLPTGQGRAMLSQMGRVQGNRHVQRVVAALHKNATPPTAQAKLAVGEADDAYEQEADQVADRVMRMTSPPSPPPSGGAPEAPSEVRRALLQASGEAGGEVSPGLEGRIAGMTGGGQALPESERAFFEPRMGMDLSNVRVHTGSDAAQTSRDLSARAYTVGNDIMFNAGEYQPGTVEGRRLLAHEITHVAQQGGAAPVKRAPLTGGKIQRTKVEEATIPQPTAPALPTSEEQAALEGTESKSAEKETPQKQDSFTKASAHQGAEQDQAPTGDATPQTSANVKDTLPKFGPTPPETVPEGEAPEQQDQAAQAPSPAPAQDQATTQTEPAPGQTAQDQVAQDQVAQTPPSAPAQGQTEQSPGPEQAQQGPATASPQAEAEAKPQTQTPPQIPQGPESEEPQGKTEQAPEGAEKPEPQAAEGEEAATPEGEQAQAALEQAEGEMQAAQEQEEAAAEGETQEMQAEAEQEQGEADAAQSEAQAAQSQLDNEQAASPGAQVAFAPLPSTPGPGSLEHALEALGADVSPIRAHRQQEQAEASQRLQAFLAQISARVDGVAALGQQAQARIEPQAQQMQSMIQSAVQENIATITTTIEQARNQVAMEAEQARGEITGQYDSTVAALEAKTDQARSEIEAEYTSKLAALDALEAAKAQEIEGKFQSGQDKVRQAADSAAAQATATGDQYKGRYQGESYPEPGFFDGSDYYENKRKAKVDAAGKVAKGYADEFKKKGEETAGQLSGGSADVVGELRAKVDSGRQAVEGEHASAIAALDQSLQQSLATAQDTLDSQLAAVADSETSTLTMLDELQTSLVAQTEQAGQEQSVAVENAAQQSIAGIQQAVAQSSADLNAAVQQIAAQAGAIPAPSPEQLAPFLEQAGAEFDGLYAQTESSLHAQIDSASQNLDMQGQQALETINGFGEDAVTQSTPITENFTTSLSELVNAAITSLTDLETSHGDSTDQQVAQSLQNFNAAFTQAQQDADNILNCLQGGLDKFINDFSQGLQPTLQEIPGKIESEAQKAADKVQPAWKKVVAFVLTVIITVVVAVAITALVASGVGLGLGLLLAAGIGALGGVAKGMIKNWSEGEAIMKDFWKNAALGALDGMLQFVGGRFVKGLNLPKTGFKQVAIKQAVNTATGLVNDVTALAVNGQLTWKTAGQTILKNLVSGVVGLGTGGITDRMGLPEKGLKKALVDMGMGSLGDTVSGMTDTFVIKGEKFTYGKAFQVVGESVTKNVLTSGIKLGFEKIDFENKLAQKFDELAGTSSTSPDAEVKSGSGVLEEDAENKSSTKLGGEEEGDISSGKSATDLDDDGVTVNKLKGSQIAEQKGYPDAPEGYHWARNGSGLILKRNPGKASDPNYPPIMFDENSRSFIPRGGSSSGKNDKDSGMGGDTEPITDPSRLLPAPDAIDQEITSKYGDKATDIFRIMDQSGTNAPKQDVAERVQQTYDFYEKSGFEAHRIPGHAQGIDFSKPVQVTTLKKGTVLEQWQVPGGPQGNYYALPNTSPSQLGISDMGTDSGGQVVSKQVTQYVVLTEDVEVLQSTAAPVVDTWSVQGKDFPTEGGGTQFFTTNKGAFKPVTEGDGGE